MVEPDEVREYKPSRPATGTIDHRRVRTSIRWTKSLHTQIKAEAKHRGWSFGRMVRHLCEASIEGIE